MNEEEMSMNHSIHASDWDPGQEDEDAYSDQRMWLEEARMIRDYGAQHGPLVRRNLEEEAGLHPGEEDVRAERLRAETAGPTT